VTSTEFQELAHKGARFLKGTEKPKSLSGLTNDWPRPSGGQRLAEPGTSASAWISPGSTNSADLPATLTAGSGRSPACQCLCQLPVPGPAAVLSLARRGETAAGPDDPAARSQGDREAGAGIRSSRAAGVSVRCPDGPQIRPAARRRRGAYTFTFLNDGLAQMVSEIPGQVRVSPGPRPALDQGGFAQIWAVCRELACARTQDH
jgi:hypothetical protein